MKQNCLLFSVSLFVDQFDSEYSSDYETFEKLQYSSHNLLNIYEIGLELGFKLTWTIWENRGGVVKESPRLSENRDHRNSTDCINNNNLAWKNSWNS